MYAIYALFGGGIGLILFAVVFGGCDYVFLGQAEGIWDGPVTMIVLCGIGAGWGLISYRFRHHELDADTAGLLGALISRRGRTVILGIVALYFIYDLARGM